MLRSDPNPLEVIMKVTRLRGLCRSNSPQSLSNSGKYPSESPFGMLTLTRQGKLERSTGAAGEEDACRHDINSFDAAEATYKVRDSYKSQSNNRDRPPDKR
jgi:hypothetical protein